MGEITPDLREWLLADSYVCSHWPQFASSLHLSSSTPSLSVTRPDSWTDSHKLSQLLYLWRRDQPGTYNVRTLLRVLRMLGLRDMEQWIQLMVGRRYHRSAEIGKKYQAVGSLDSLFTSDKEDHNFIHPGKKKGEKSSLSSHDQTVSPSSDYNGCVFPSSDYNYCVYPSSDYTNCVSPSSDYNDCVSPALLNTSYTDLGYSDYVSPTSDSGCVPVHNKYSSDSGLSSTFSDIGDKLTRSCLTIDVSTGRFTRVDSVTDDDLIERSFHSVLHSAGALCQSHLMSNLSFLSKKKEKFVPSRLGQRGVQTRQGGVFSTLFRPEGKVLTRLREGFDDNSQPEDCKQYIQKFKKKKDLTKPNIGIGNTKEMRTEKYFDNIIKTLQMAIQSLDW